MDMTLGKRIMSERKKLGLTQDKLAEALSVTAQAVSKWENDQSCPDITMLPRLAELFHISTDELLGVVSKEEPETVKEPVVLEGTVEDPSSDDDGHSFTLDWEPGKRHAILLALLVLTVGALTLLSAVLNWSVSFWSILWPSTILWFGISILAKKFSVFGIACGLFGGYFLLENLNITSLGISWKLIFPVLILLFGLSLLVDAVKKPKKGHFRYHPGTKDGKKPTENNYFVDGDTFRCSLSFGENVRYITMDALSAADISCSFGELTIDLTGVQEFSSNCKINANCSFGELILRVPRSIRVEPNSSTAFASMEFVGMPDADQKGVLCLDADVSFGEISIHYI